MRSYAQCSFLERRAEAQILPKSGEKSRHQPVFSTLARALKTLPYVNALTLTSGCFVDRPKT